MERRSDRILCSAVITFDVKNTANWSSMWRSIAVSNKFLLLGYLKVWIGFNLKFSKFISFCKWFNRWILVKILNKTKKKK